MSLSQPTRKVEYKAPGGSWTEIQDDVVDFDIWLRDLAAGMSEFNVTLDNSGGKYSKSGGTFPAFGAEGGFHYLMRFRVNDAYLLVGRIVSAAPSLKENKCVFKIHGRCLGQGLNNRLIQDKWTDEKADDIIEDAFTKAGCTDVTYTSPSTAPKVSVDAMQNPRFLNDLIREICEQVDYAAFVKTQAAVEQGTLLFFPKADSGRRHSTVLRSLTESAVNNIAAYENPRSIDEIKNWAYFMGRLSNYEPADQDAWTESDKGWYSKGITSLYVDQSAVAPILSGTKYSILGVTFSKLGPFFRFSIPDWLGEDFNCTVRAGDFLHFWYAISPGVEDLMDCVLTSVVLEDGDGNRIYHPLETIADIGRWDFWQTLLEGLWNRFIGLFGVVQTPPVPGKRGWREVSIPIGDSAQMSIYIEGEAGHPSRIIPGDWSFERGYHTFNWDKIRFIDFEDWQWARLTSTQNKLWIDGLYFHQAYTPVYTAKAPQVNIDKYGLRMERPTTVDFVELSDLKAYADKVMEAMCQPTLLLDVDAVINPAAEALYPAYSIPVHITDLGITSGYPWFRILEIHYHWGSEGLQTSFQLIPSTVV